MASRYWVGASSSNWADTGNWSTSSGGSGGASVPTSSDDVFFNSLSGSGGCSTGGVTREVNNLNMTGSSETINGSFGTINVYGDLTLSSNSRATLVTFNLDGNNNTRTFTTNNSPASGCDIRIGNSNSFAPTVNLNGSLTVGLLIVSKGTFNTNNYAMTLSSFTNYNTGASNLGSSTVTLTKGNSGDVVYLGNTNVNFGTSTIKIATNYASGNSIFCNGSSQTFYNLEIATSYAISLGAGSHSFNNITNSVQPATLKFPASYTQTVSNFSLSGTSGNLVTINTTTGSGTFTLSKSSGLVNLDYLSVTNSTATGGASWFAGPHSTNGGGNTGWFFTSPAAGLLTFW